MITILKAIRAQINDCLLVDQDKHGGGHSEVYHDLANAMWHIESAVKRLQAEEE